ncbi:uncharacterized protein MONOS_18320 [Monocercomonoides exilis]|uniref:uncharacterized protein n=1 Tax=Monocercomonoides exilis TaxID=2049356 RepID=UPI00355A9767|nr:hypothetical protein MONOS_18320 [Monocercomonoides exilis]
MNEDDWTDDMWFMDVPITLQAYEEDVSENWAPRGTRAWGLQMQNAIMYIDSLEGVYQRAIRAFMDTLRRMQFRNRRRPRALRRRALNTYRAMSPSMRKSMFHTGYKLARRRVNLNSIGQGRVQNWKQIKQTGTGKKIHRRVTPQQISTQHSDYILYKSRYEMYFHYGDGRYPLTGYSHAYVRVLIFRKWGSYVQSLQSRIWSMFKYPNILTSGYVHGFRRRWLKEFGAQLYSDKLLRISDETNWVTEYKINIYPNAHTRYNSVVDTDRYYYTMVILGGFGPEDKFSNTWTAEQVSSLTLTYNMNVINYWKFVSGMPINENQIQYFSVSGLPTQDSSNRPRIAEGLLRVDSGSSGNDPAGETGASSSNPVHTSSFSIIHDDN